MLSILIFALMLYVVPGPDSPACEPGQVSDIDKCYPVQDPRETIGRVITDMNGNNWVISDIDENGNPILILVNPNEPPEVEIGEAVEVVAPPAAPVVAPNGPSYTG